VRINRLPLSTRRFPCHPMRCVYLMGPGSFKRPCPEPGCHKRWIVEVAPSPYLTVLCGRITYRPYWTLENEMAEAS
jgi:hypothetical protein